MEFVDQDTQQEQAAPIAEDTISTPTLVPTVVTTKDTVTIEQKNNQAMAALTASQYFIEMVSKVAVLQQEAMQVADMVIVSPEQEVALTDLVGRIQVTMNQLDLRRQSVIAFPRLFVDTVNGLFGTPKGEKGLYCALRGARTKVEKPILAWRKKQEDARRAAYEAQEAERLQRLSQVASGEMTPEQAMEQGGVDAPPPLEEGSKTVEAPSGKATVGKNTEFKIVDLKLVCSAVIAGVLPEDCVKITLQKTKLKQWVKGCQLKGEVVDLPGILVEEKSGLKVTTKKE